MHKWLLLGALILLTGCQLARESEQWQTEESHFVGFFITLESLEAGWVDIFGGAERLYIHRTDSLFDFPVAGIPFFAGTALYDWGEVTFNEVGAGITATRGLHVHFMDEGTRFYLEGTLYVNPRLANQVYVFHPVFQAPDRQFYIGRGGSSVSVARSGYFTDGPIQGFTRTHEVVHTVNGVSTTHFTSAEINIAVMHPPQEIILLEMDAAAQVVARHAFAPDALPLEFAVQQRTVYIIVETHREHDILRALVNAGDSSFPLFYEGADGVMHQQWVQVVW